MGDLLGSGLLMDRRLCHQHWHHTLHHRPSGRSLPLLRVLEQQGVPARLRYLLLRVLLRRRSTVVRIRLRTHSGGHPRPGKDNGGSQYHNRIEHPAEPNKSGTDDDHQDHGTRQRILCHQRYAVGSLLSATEHQHQYDDNRKWLLLIAVCLVSLHLYQSLHICRQVWPGQTRPIETDSVQKDFRRSADRRSNRNRHRSVGLLIRPSQVRDKMR